jgi:hypothetical protein
VAVSFCNHDERSSLQAIQRLTRQTLDVGECPAGLPAAAVTAAPTAKRTGTHRPVDRISFRPGRGGGPSGRYRGPRIHRKKLA